MWKYLPEKKCWQFYSSGANNPIYWCEQCKHHHRFMSKIGKEHLKFGKFPNFPFFPGHKLIYIPKGTKLQPLREEE